MKRSRTFFTVFIPNTIIVSSTLLLSVAIMSSLFINESKKNLIKQEQENLYYICRVFTEIQNASVPSFVTAMTSKPINNYLFGDNVTNEMLLDTLDMLGKTAVGNNYIDSIYLYNSRKGLISTRAGYEAFNFTSDPSLKEFLTNTGKYKLSNFILRRTKFISEKNYSNLISIILGGQTPENMPVKYALVANISERKMRSILFNDKSSISDLFIVNEEGIFISHPDADKFNTSSMNDVRFASVFKNTSTSGSATCKDDDGVSWIVSWVEQPEFRYKFVSCTKRDIVFSAIIYLRNISYTVIAVIMVLALTMLYISFIKEEQYRKHIRQVMEFLHSDNETLLQSQQGIYAQYKKGNFLSFRKEISLAEICLDSPDRFKRNIENEIHICISKLKLHSHCIHTPKNTYIIFFSTETPNPQISIRSLLDLLHSDCGILAGGYVLSKCTLIEDMRDKYYLIEKSYALDYLRKTGELVVIDMEGVSSDEINEEDLEIDTDLTHKFHEMDRAFKSGDKHEIDNSTEKIISMLKSSKSDDVFRFTKSYFCKRIPIILGDDAEFLLGDVSVFQNDFFQNWHLDTFENKLKSVAEKIQGRVQSGTEQKKSELIKNIKKMIQKDIADPSLCTAEIASKMGFSTGYIRNLFKQSTGMSLSDYIGFERIELAKSYLIETNKTIRDICSETGFINYPYFFTYFKKITGKTPIEYREAAKKSNS